MDKSQGQVASSVAKLAERMHLPALLVDMRHAATHGAALPAWPVLWLAREQVSWGWGVSEREREREEH